LEAKTPKDLKLIEAALDRHLLFQEMDAITRLFVIGEMQKMTLPAGADVYLEGASPQLFMVLVDGCLRVGWRKEVSPGKEFGEETFLTDLPRNERVVTKTKVELWALNKAHFIAVKDKLRTKKAEEIQQLLFAVSKRFRALTKSQVRKVALVATEVRADAGSVLTSIGLCTEVCFLVREGKTSLGANINCIGKSQLAGKPCKHTVSALTSVLAWKIEKKGVDAVLWPSLQHTLQHNFLKSALRACNFPLRSEELNTVMRCSAFHSYKQKETVLLQSEPGACMCFVLQGQLVFQSQPDTPISSIRSKSEDWGGEFTLPSDVLVSSKSALVAFLPLSLFAVSLQGEVRVTPPSSILQEDLKEVPLFQTLSAEKLEELSLIATEVCYEKETVIVQKGEMARFIYVIKSGFGVIGQHTSREHIVGPGNFFGQHTWLYNEPVVNNFMAYTKLVCLTFPINSLQNFLKGRTKKWIQWKSALQDTKWSLDSFLMLRTLDRVRGGGIFLVGNKIDNMLCMLSAVTITGETDDSDTAKAHQAIGRLAHPFLMSWMPTLRLLPFTYYGISFVQGQSLAQLLKDLPRGLHNREARFYVACLTLLLEHFHSCKITFRNLQMDTVHVDATGYPTLIDFKRCKLTTERTYTIATSPWYTAPETLRREGAGLEVDYWSLGVLLYECMFSTFPFGTKTQSPYEIYDAVLLGKYEFPYHSEQELWPVEEVIELLLVSNPAKRLPGGLKALKQHSWFRGLDWVTAK